MSDKAPAGAASPRAITRIPTERLHRELRRREVVLAGLERQARTLQGRLDRLDAQIQAEGGMPRGRSRARGRGAGRPRNDNSLVAALSKLLSGKAMRVTDAVGAVQKAGYRTSSPNFRTIVNAALLNQDVFKRVGRGTYTSR